MHEVLEPVLQLAGVLLILNGLGHVLLPRILGWRTGFASLSRLDRQVSYVHVYFVGLGCVTWGALALFAAPELVAPSGALATVTLIAGTLFCASRLVVQFVFDRILWRHYKFGQPAFVLSALWWTGETLAFALPLLSN